MDPIAPPRKRARTADRVSKLVRWRTATTPQEDWTVYTHNREMDRPASVFCLCQRLALAVTMRRLNVADDVIAQVAQRFQDIYDNLYTWWSDFTTHNRNHRNPMFTMSLNDARRLERDLATLSPAQQRVLVRHNVF